MDTPHLPGWPEPALAWPRAQGRAGADRGQGPGGHPLAPRLRPRAPPVRDQRRRPAQPAAADEPVRRALDGSGGGGRPRPGTVQRRARDPAARDGCAAHDHDPPGAAVQRVSERRSRVRRGVRGGGAPRSSVEDGTREAMTTTLARPAEPPVHLAPDPHTDRPLIVCLVLALVLGLAAGTQYVAWRFHFHTNLGAPLAVVPSDTARWLRATGVLAAGTALVGVLLTWLRPLSVPFLLVAAWAALA